MSRVELLAKVSCEPREAADEVSRAAAAYLLELKEKPRLGAARVLEESLQHPVHIGEPVRPHGLGQYWPFVADMPPWPSHSSPAMHRLPLDYS